MRGTYHRRFMTVEERMSSFIGDPDENGCRAWTGQRLKSGGTDVNGYGYLKVDGTRRRVTRLLWELENGDIPQGMLVLHSCDHPWCCSIEHLFLGTHAANMADKVSKGRQARAHRKLSEDDAKAILKMSEDGISISQIRDEFGVSYQAAWCVVRGKNFTYLGGAR